MSIYNNLVTEIPCLTLSGYPLNMQMQSIQINNTQIRLRSKLWQVLVHLLENKSRLVTRQVLIQFCWQGNNLTGEHGVTHTICHLRRIIKKYGLVDTHIITIPKKGYIMEDRSITQFNNTFVKENQLSENHNLYKENFLSSFMELSILK